MSLIPEEIRSKFVPEPVKCGRCCPCCNRYELVGSMEQWTCQWCNQVGTLEELLVIRSKQLRPGEPLFEFYDDLTEEENQYINEVRVLGFDEIGPNGLETFTGACQFVRKRLIQIERQNEVALTITKLKDMNDEKIRREWLAKVLNVEAVSKTGRVVFVEEPQIHEGKRMVFDGN